jgi:uracil-DNA glycosylase
MRDRTPTIAASHLDKIKAPHAIHPTFEHESLKSISELQGAAKHCQRCELHCYATQTVFGEGNDTAEIMFVGEQPGDQEDIAGKPFVGPAGHIFAEALRAANINRSDVYVTNAVKHFKFSPRGKRRLHERPNQLEILACKWWLDQEIGIIKPKLLVALGSTALFAITGNGKDITKRRGKFEKTEQGLDVFVTYHPSAILRNHAEANKIRRDFFADIASIEFHMQGLQK